MTEFCGKDEAHWAAQAENPSRVRALQRRNVRKSIAFDADQTIRKGKRSKGNKLSSIENQGVSRKTREYPRKLTAEPE